MIVKSEIVVRYQETDQMGIVHHSVYPIWYEVSRAEFCRQIGMPYSQMEKAGLMTPIYEVSSKYRAPARYEDVLTVEARLTKVTEYRMEFSYRIFCKDTLIHTGKTIHVFVGSEDFKLTNLKKHFPTIFQLLKDNLTEEEFQ